MTAATGFFTDEEAHPTTLELVKLLRELIAVDTFATLKLIGANAAFMPDVAKIPGIQIHTALKVDEKDNASVPTMGTLGLINAMMRRLNADEIGFEFNARNDVTFIGAKWRERPAPRVATMLTDESVVGYDPNKEPQT